MTLSWRLAHPAAPHLHGWDGQHLVGQVNFYDGPVVVEQHLPVPPRGATIETTGPAFEVSTAGYWVGHVRNTPVTGRVASAEEAQRLVEEAL